MGGKISKFPDLKKRTVVVEITRRWGHCITEEETIIFLEEEDRVREGEIPELRGRQRMDQGGLNIVLFCFFFIVTRPGKEASHHFVQMYPEIFLLNHHNLHPEVSIIIGEEEGRSHKFV